MDLKYPIKKNVNKVYIEIKNEDIHESININDKISADTFLLDKDGKPIWLITNSETMKKINENNDSRSFVGGHEEYDFRSAIQFILLIQLGLREHHNVCDIGCGDLGLGRLLIPYLNKGKYCGIEPVVWVLEKGVNENTGHDIHKIKETEFLYNQTFDFSKFKRKFDYMIACSVFSHAHPTQIRQCLKNVEAVLTDDGKFVASYVKSDENHYLSGWVYPGVNFYTEEFMKQMAHEAGLNAQAIENVYAHQYWMIFKRDKK